MSLQIAAKHLASKGRGPDTTLVHMTNKEVQGLQTLAEKNGGSLSVNPDTGLPEAGFLESILPVVAGVGLTAAGMGPMAAALTVGGVSALSTGSLSKGLFAGLGAYGGASLGGQLATQGMTEAAAANASFGDRLASMGQNASFENIGNFISANPKTAMAGLAGPLLSSMEDDNQNDKPSEPEKDTDLGERARSGVKYNPGYVTPTPLPNPYGIEQTYARPYYAAEGGVAHMAEGGMAYGGSTSIDTKSQFADYLNKVMNPTNRTNAVSGSTNPYDWWKNSNDPAKTTPAAPAAAPTETPEEYATRTRANARGSSGPSPEEREARLNEVNDYLSTPENPVTMNQYWAMSSEDRKALDADAAKRNPMRAGIGDFVKTAGYPMFLRGIEGLKDIYSKFTGPDTSNPKSVGMVFPTEKDRIKAEETAKYRQSLLGDTSGYETTPVKKEPAVLSRQERDVPDAVAQTNAVLPRQMNDIPVALSRQERDVPDAVAQTNAALGYTFKPNAVQDILKNFPTSDFYFGVPANAADAYLRANEAAERAGRTSPLVPTRYEGVVSAADLGSQFPGPAKSVSTGYGFADPAKSVSTGYGFADSTPYSSAGVGQLSSDPAVRAQQLANRSDADTEAALKLQAGTFEFPSAPDAPDAPSVGVGQLSSNPAERAQQLLNRAKTDTEAALKLQAGITPDIKGVNEIKANADIEINPVDPYAVDSDYVGQYSPTTDVAAMPLGQVVAADGSPFSATPGYGIAMPNMGNRGNSGVSFGGLGNVWRSADGTPIKNREGVSWGTGESVGQESSSDKVDRIVREAQQANPNPVSNDNDNDTSSADGADSGGYADSALKAGSPSDARGGYLQHGQFDQRMAHGGLSALPNPYNLGSFSDGGRLLRGPGDGVSDSIPATIGKGRPARLADGEFVIPARIVSEIGNGSTDAGARKLYAMMDRIQAGRKKSVGKGRVAVNSRADKYLPA